MRPATMAFAISEAGVSSGTVKNVGVMMSDTRRAPPTRRFREPDSGRRERCVSSPAMSVTETTPTSFPRAFRTGAPEIEFSVRKVTSWGTV
ncbi:MAG TPA: hypothetical protein VFZ57_07885 [Thermoanaerobaculia bacterium]|nr:hypothetical protein [Thermoanaerobaculia bacterium]